LLISFIPESRIALIVRLCTDEAADLAGEELSIQDPVFYQQAGLEE
jgi:hypothetical protein